MSEEANSAYAEKNTLANNKGNKTASAGFYMSSNKRKQQSQQQPKDKLVHLNTAIQKRFTNLRKTSKSRFDGVHKYLNGAFI